MIGETKDTSLRRRLEVDDAFRWLFIHSGLAFFCCAKAAATGRGTSGTMAEAAVAAEATAAFLRNVLRSTGLMRTCLWSSGRRTAAMIGRGLADQAIIAD